jgi:hypothetical protein
MNDTLINQPDAATQIRENLAEKHSDIMSRVNELLEAAKRAPTTIDSDETAGKMGDFSKQISACLKNAEGARVAEKEPHLAAGRTVDGWFKTLADPLDKAKTAIGRVLTDYLRVKEAAERAERERIAREEREAAAKAAETARAAEQAALDAQTMDAAIDAEELARKAAADAAAADREATVKAAELSRTRGDFGSVSSLVEFWDFKDIDRGALDLEALRQHLPMDALEKAVRSFVKAGGRSLRGATVFENSKARVA